MWRSLARRLGLALLRWAVGELNQYLLVDNPPLLAAARELTTEAEQLPHLDEDGGEYKRHWVYGRLVKRFPTTSRRDISAAIEIGLQ